MSAMKATEGRIRKSVKKRVLEPQTAHRSNKRVKNEVDDYVGRAGLFARSIWTATATVGMLMIRVGTVH